MKIVCFIDSLSSGGAQRQLVELAIGFKKEGHEVIFLVYHEINFFKIFLDEYDIPVLIVNETNPLIRIIKCRNVIRNVNPDVILSFLVVPNFIATLAGFPFRKWKLVVGERSADPAILKSNKKKTFRWFHVFADHIICNSNSNREIIQKVNPFISKKISVIYNLAVFPLIKSNVQFPIGNKKIEIIILARYHKTKNARGLINAFALLDEKEKQKFNVTWYGSKKTIDNEFEKSERLIKKLKLNNYFTLNEVTSKVPEVISNSNVVGLFSFFEGLPNTICEALSFGKIVIASNVSDIPILLNNDNRLLFNPNDSKDIARVLKNLIHLSLNETIEIENQNFEFAKENFKKKRIVLKYLNIFK